MKEVLEQIKVGFDPQERFTKMNKNRDVENGIRGQVMRMNPPNGEGGPGRNQKRENRGLEEHKEGKQQIRSPPHEEKTPLRIYANGPCSEAEEDDSLPDSTDESQCTY
jgi:hypothetical protein